MVVIVETVERLLAVFAQEALPVEEVVFALLLLGQVYLLVAEVTEVAAVLLLRRFVLFELCFEIIKMRLILSYIT